MLKDNQYLLNPQKALHKFKELEKKKPKCFGKQYIVDIKEDGWFGYYCLNTGKVHASTSGREPISCTALARAMREDLGPVTPKTQPSFLLFELRVHGVDDFYTTNGLLNRSTVCKDIYIIVHDYVCLEGGVDKTPYHQRREHAYNLYKRLGNYARFTTCVGRTFDKDKWQAAAEAAWDKGEEGVILRDLKAPYEEGKRNCNLMKIKMECDADMVVVDMKRGQGKYSDTLGALVCRTKDGTLHEISGMTDAMRATWWNYPTDILGSIIEIKAMKRNPDGTFREPRFGRVRNDKTVDDID